MKAFSEQVKYCLFQTVFAMLTSLLNKKKRNSVSELEYGLTVRPDLDLWPARSIPK